MKITEPNRVMKKDVLEESPVFAKYVDDLDEDVGNARKVMQFKRFLAMFDHHDEFYTITNIKTQQITWSRGISKWTGYADINKETAPASYFTDYVHPFIKEWYKALNDAAVVMLSQIPTTYLQSRFVIRVPIRFKDGRYVLVKQMSMPFEKDSKGLVSSYINSYSVFGPYRAEPLKPELYGVDDATKGNMSLQLGRLITPCMQIKRSRRLTAQQFTLVKAIKLLKKENAVFTAQDITDVVNSFGKKIISKETVERYQLELRDRLQWLLKLDQPEKLQVDENDLHYAEGLPQGDALIDFAEESGIIDLLDAYNYNLKKQ